MANKAKGEVGFEADGKAYTLVFTFNAMCALESQLDGETFAGVAAAMVSGRLKAMHIRAMIWAGLQRDHKGVTVNQAGDLVDDIGLTGTTGSFAHLQEFGTAHSAPRPFLRPAIDAMGAAVIETFRRELKVEIDKAIQRR